MSDLTRRRLMLGSSALGIGGLLGGCELIESGRVDQVSTA